MTLSNHCNDAYVLAKTIYTPTQTELSKQTLAEVNLHLNADFAAQMFL